MSINLILTSHATLAQGALEAYAMLAGTSERMCSVGLTAAGIDDFRARLAATVEAKLTDGPVLILADLVGGTPYNESYALMLAHPNEVRVVAGLNLPMLLTVGFELADATDLDALATLAVEVGAQGVSLAELPADDTDASSDDELF